MGDRMTPVEREKAIRAASDGGTVRLRRELAAVAGCLGVDELRVLLMIATRLREGQRQYGRFNLATDRRDWVRETLEELADATVYLTASRLANGGKHGKAAVD